MKYLKDLKRFFLKSNNDIPKNIEQRELILRALFDPLFFSQNKFKLRPTSLLPSKRANNDIDKATVSLYRRDFCDDSYCKNQAILIPMKTYVGFLTFYLEHVQKINTQFDPNEIQADIRFSPLDENSNRIHVHTGKFYISDKGVPTHAELVYSRPIVFDDPNPFHNKYAKAMLTLIEHSVFIDCAPTHLGWNQPKMHFKNPEI